MVISLSNDIKIPTIVYHYTVGNKLQSIYSNGHLQTSPLHPKLGEKPVVWLSKNTKYEKTALKSIVMPGDTSSSLATLKVLDQYADGVYRFAFRTEDAPVEILPWILLKNKAKMPKKVVARLLKRSKSIGGKSSDWFGTLDVLGINSATLQRLSVDTMEWVDTSEVDGRSVKPRKETKQVIEKELPPNFRITDKTWEV